MSDESTTTPMTKPRRRRKQAQITPEQSESGAADVRLLVGREEPTLSFLQPEPVVSNKASSPTNPPPDQPVNMT